MNNDIDNDIYKECYYCCKITINYKMNLVKVYGREKYICDECFLEGEE